jgi:pilus assembly protein CpaF
MNGLLGLYNNDPLMAIPSLEVRNEVINEVIDLVNQEFPPATLQAPIDQDRQKISERELSLIGMALRRRNSRPGMPYETSLAEELTRRLIGLGFLDLLLPPTRNDLSEICVYSSGLVQVMRKGSVRWETIDLRPDPGEIWRVLDRLLGPQNKTLNEANPTINAKLPATPHNPGGGRIKALHPVIAPPGRNPSINLRLYEQKPVRPEWILEKGVMSAEMMATVEAAMQAGCRVLITGGTRTGKDALLPRSAISFHKGGES